MPDAVIHSVSTCDARFPLPPGAGTDSLHTNSEYSFAVTRLSGENGLSGTGIALTLGKGNKLVCEAIEMLANPLAGTAIEELMADFGRVSRKLADDPSLRFRRESMVSPGGLIGVSLRMRTIHHLIGKARDHAFPVIILGETGTERIGATTSSFPPKFLTLSWAFPSSTFVVRR